MKRPAPAASDLKMEQALAEQGIGMRATHRRKKEQAVRRLRTISTELKESMRAMKVSFTEAASVTTATVEKYQRAIEKFLAATEQKEVTLDLHKLDDLVVTYFDQCCLEGLGAGAGSLLLAALHFRLPRLVGRGCVQLPRAIRSQKGWQKLRPTQTKQPLPWNLCMAIARCLKETNGIAWALAWLVMVDSYLRPSEALRLQASQVLQPSRDFGMRGTTLYLNPIALGRRSKTGELDESVAINRPFIGKAIARLALMKRRGEVLFGPTLAEMRNAFVRAAHRCGVGHLQPVLYMGRHSGASLDSLEGRLKLEEIKKRGRWRTDASVRRYEKHALVQKVWLEMAETDRRFARRAAATLPVELSAFGRGAVGTASGRASCLSSSTSSAARRE